MRFLQLLPFICLLFLGACTAEEREPLQVQRQTLQADEVITVQAAKTIDVATLNDQRVFVTNKDGERVTGQVTISGQVITIMPPEHGYTAGDYTITITEALLATDGTAAIPNGHEQLVTVPVRYTIEREQNGEVVQIGQYATLAQAEADMTPDSVLYDGNTAIRIPDGQGLLITAAEGTTTLYRNYENGAFQDAATYVSPNAELRLIQRGEQAIKVSLANEQFYIEHGAHTYVPFYTERTHYSVDKGQLYFHVMNYEIGNLSTFALGKAPSFMAPSSKYYSEDGYTFYDARNEFVGHYAPYFQFLSLRSTTHYTAEELDRYIVSMLQEREQQGGQYENAATTSKLLGLGTVLKEIEQTYHVNALLILALAQHESDYGMSNHAQTHQNLFGLYVYDSNPANKTFASVQANVEELVTQFLNKNYIPPTAGYAHGPYFGNKVQGVNVRYASDQFWGVKAAGHAYRIDRALGGKEYERYALMQLADDVGRVHVRRDASEQQAAIYTIRPAAKQFVTAYREQSAPTWLSVISDSGRYTAGYIQKSAFEQ